MELILCCGLDLRRVDLSVWCGYSCCGYWCVVDIAVVDLSVL